MQELPAVFTPSTIHMKHLTRAGLVPAIILAGLLQASHAGSFSADFNDGLLPAGSALYGNGTSAGVIETIGGFENTAAVGLTRNQAGLTGSYMVSDLDSGNPVNGFTANFKMRIGPGSGNAADGVSFCVGNDLGTAAFGEGGVGTGLRVAFDTYNNGDGDNAPAFHLYWGGTRLRIASVSKATLVTSTWVDVMVRVHPDGAVDVTHNGNAIWTKAYVGYQPIAGASFAWGGRTGGETEAALIDNISITTTTGLLQPAITSQPASIRLVPGYSAPFIVTANNAAATFQWEKKGLLDAGFTAIPGAESSSYQTPLVALADAGTQYRVVVTLNGASVTSEPATLDVVTLPHGTPTVSYMLDETELNGMGETVGVVPAGTVIHGTASVQVSGGVGDSGYLRLTEAVNGQTGLWTIDDLNSGNPVESIDITFKLKMSDGSTTPADGFGFHWAPNLTTASFAVAEEATAAGLSVCFDVYDNGGGEGPAIDVFWLGNRVGGIKVPGQFLNTQSTFQDVCIRLSAAGQIDVMFNGLVLAYQLQVPGWTAFSQANYGFAARTGGLNQVHAIDEITIRSVPYAGPIGVITHPAPVTTLVGRTATFSVTSNDPAATTYQWQKQPSGGSFADIPGAGSQTYTTPALAAGDHASQYRCVVTSTRNATTATSNAATLTVINVARPVAPQVNYTFDDGTTVSNVGTAGVAATATLSGNATIFADGGTSGTGSIRLTEYANGQYGTLVLENFSGSAAVGGFTMAVNAQIFGASPADGWSLSWGDTIAASLGAGIYENGVGDDLRVGFVTYAPNVPGVQVFWQGNLLLKVPVPITVLQTAGDGSSEEVLIKLEQDVSGVGAKITVAQDGVLLVDALNIPGFTGLANGRFALAARTGGAFEEHRFDDFCIQTIPYVGPIAITAEPVGFTVVNGKEGTISVEVNDPNRTSFQWEAATAEAGPFGPVAGAQSAVLTGVPPPSSTTWFRCVCTATSNVVTSIPVPVRSVDLALPAWERHITFDDGFLPADMLNFGTAAAMTAGGVAGTGMVQLTANAGGQQGSIALEDQDPGQRVLGFSTRFFLRIGDTSPIPADGGSFVWSPEPITGAFGEAGTGGGLVVAFDTYDNVDADPNNAAGEAPAIRIIWKGGQLANVRVPLSLLVTEADWVEVIVRVNTDGTLDVVWDCFVAAWKMPLPAFAPVAGASFGWGGRTGGSFAAQEVDEIQITTIAEPKPLIDITRSGGDLSITFDGVLQTTTVPGGLSGWVDVPGATSPFVVPVGADQKKYWRARR